MANYTFELRYLRAIRFSNYLSAFMRDTRAGADAVELNVHCQRAFNWKRNQMKCFLIFLVFHFRIATDECTGRRSRR